MSRKINPKQMEAWTAKLQTNIRQFLNKETATPEQRAAFAKQQHAALNILVKAAKGEVYFVGCSHPNSK